MRIASRTMTSTSRSPCCRRLTRTMSSSNILLEFASPLHSLVGEYMEV